MPPETQDAGRVQDPAVRSCKGMPPNEGDDEDVPEAVDSSSEEGDDPPGLEPSIAGDDVGRNDDVDEFMSEYDEQFIQSQRNILDELQKRLVKRSTTKIGIFQAGEIYRCKVYPDKRIAKLYPQPPDGNINPRPKKFRNMAHLEQVGPVIAVRKIYTRKYEFTTLEVPYGDNRTAFVNASTLKRKTGNKFDWLERVPPTATPKASQTTEFVASLISQLQAPDSTQDIQASEAAGREQEPTEKPLTEKEFTMKALISNIKQFDSATGQRSDKNIFDMDARQQKFFKGCVSSKSEKL